MKKALLAGVMLAVWLVSGCTSGPRLVTDYDTAYGFGELRSFALAEADAQRRTNILISPFTYQHLDRAVIDALTPRYTLAGDTDSAGAEGTGDEGAGDESSPDFLVRYEIVMEDKLDPRGGDLRYGMAFGYGPFWPSAHYHLGSSSPRTYTRGSLVIDFVEADTGEPIWHGVAEQRVSDRQNPERQREVLGEAVAQLLAQFPPTQKPR